MSIVLILVTIILPPLAVAMKHGIGTTFLINILLTLLGWLPGVIHAFYVNSRA
ncbi:MAG: YqaE/Pmp3 family membrane protein [Cytophagaceae bacterium]|nr:YqaE/Pmp3 family membrane protein [Cytophagaceae bacterium]